jgi:hypothetical protein
MVISLLSKRISSAVAWRCSQIDWFQHSNEVRSDGIAAMIVRITAGTMARTTARMVVRITARIIVSLMMERLLTVLWILTMRIVNTSSYMHFLYYMTSQT